MWLLNWIKSFFSNKAITVPVKPVLEGNTITMTREEFLSVLEAKGIQPISLATPLDGIVRFAKKEELDRIVSSLVYPGEWYKLDLWDCEDFGLQAQLDAGRKFEISVRLALGWINNPNVGNKDVYHGFALTMDTNLNIWLLEPNSGFPYSGKWFKIGDNGYKVDKILI